MTTPLGPDDEFGDLQERAREIDLPWKGAPSVSRRSARLPDGRQISALCWGSEAPRIVLLHGGAQNAHTWDTVALALDLPLIAIDLPGHGHSSWRNDGNYGIPTLAKDVASAIPQFAPGATLWVGMGLGGAVARRALGQISASPKLLALVDAGAGNASTRRPKATQAGESVKAFVSGEVRFASFEEMLSRTLRFNSGRSESSLRRGLRHNARELPDGGWTWRWDPAIRGNDHSQSLASESAGPTVPLLIIRGSESDVLSDEEAAEFVHEPGIAGVVSIEGAGHGVQGDRPVELARVLKEHLPG